MSRLDLIAQDLNAFAVAGQADYARGKCRVPPETIGALFGVLDEIEQSSVFVAMAASIATALLDPYASSVLAKDLDTYGPSEPVVYPAVSEKLFSEGLDHAVLLRVQAFYVRLAFARRLSRAVISAGPAPSEEIWIQEIEKLADAWRHACGTALGAMAALRSALTGAGACTAAPQNQNAEGLLQLAYAGARPCVSETGHIAVPSWAETRRSQRFSVRLTARVFTGGSAQTAMIENISETGIGLSNIRGAERGASITVELPGDDLVTGRIMWSQNGRTGVKFDAKLPAKHPMLAPFANESN